MSKQVMRVMMVGLVAMLAAKAEAHTRWINYRIWYCAPSVCHGGHTEQGGEVDPPGHIEVAEARLQVPQNGAEVLCQKGTEVLPVSLNLVVRKQIEDFTDVTDENRHTARLGTVVFISPDSALKEYVAIKEHKCKDGSTPSDVLFRQFFVHSRTLTCDPSQKECSEVGSTVEATCTTPDKFNFSNPPSIGALPNCTIEVKQ